MEDPTQERLQAILDSPSYRVAIQDTQFLESDAARSSRLALEFDRTDSYLRAARIDSTVVVFGSARIVEPETAAAALLAAERLAPEHPDRAAAVAHARRDVNFSRYYDEARMFGRELGFHCSTASGRHQLVVATGGGPGIMEAANRGASDAGAPSVGFNIRLPREQKPNPWITPGLAFSFHYFALRKMHFLLRARALVAFPGGYGTLDEVFEALNLVATGTIPPMPILLVGHDYWTRVVNLDYLIEQGFADPLDRTLLQIVETGAEAARFILEHCR
jgi:uncharacterized protein (TIGR00730 family)